MKKYLIYSMMAAVAFTACDKDEKDKGGVSKLPVSVTFAEGSYAERETFTYDNNNRLITSTWVELDAAGNEQGSKSTYEYTYSGNDLVKIVSNNSSDVYITYLSATQIQLVEKWSSSNDTTVLELNSKGQVVKYYSSRLTYNADGTVAKTEYADGSTVTDVVTYTYDSKNGIYKNWNMPQWFIASDDDYFQFFLHNAVSYEYKYNPTVPSNSDYTVTLSIVYDADDYPTKITETDSKHPNSPGVRTIVYDK